MGITSLNIIANSVWGPEGLSGGDNIFINLARQAKVKGYEVNIFTWEDGFELCQNNNLTNVNFCLIKARKYQTLGFFLQYLLRAWFGIKILRSCFRQGLFADKKIIIYSASDFYPDSLPAFFFKKWLPNSSWFAGFYLFVPNPFKGFQGAYKKGFNIPKVKELLYYLSQKPVFWLLKKYADKICVTSDPDVQYFQKANRKTDDILVIKGGIDYRELEKYQQENIKIYAAVYVGRFHPQKGVLEMIDIWNEVVKTKPKEKLAVIGVGDLEKEMQKKIGEYGLEENIVFMGPLLGEERNKILSQSKIILHPAVYDSGGMAAASGLACGLPGVCFNLSVFNSYYPKGFLYAKINNLFDFADKIILLLTNENLYQKLRTDAINEAKNWDWKKRLIIFFNNF